MRILYISRSGLPVTAAGIRVHNIAKMLTSMGHEVEIFSRARAGKGEAISQHYDGIKYHFASQPPPHV